MQPKPSPSAAIRLAEVMAALSLAPDLGMGQPLEFALTSCVLATRMGESLGMPPSDLRDVYYFGLLRFIGCNSDTYAMAALLGDELSVRSAFAAVDPGSAPQVLNLALRFMRPAPAGTPPLYPARTLVCGVLSPPHIGLLAESAWTVSRTGPITWTGVVFDTASTGSHDISGSCPWPSAERPSTVCGEITSPA